MSSKELGCLSPEEAEIKEAHRKVISSWSNLLARLHENEVGRGIVSEKWGRRDLIGYILPLDEADNSHLIIFKNGFMVVTAVKKDETEKIAARLKEIYNKEMRKSVYDYMWCGEGTERPIDIVDKLISDPNSQNAPGFRRVGHIIFTNELAGTTDRFRQQAEIALALMNLNVTQRRELVIQTTNAVSDIFNSSYGNQVLLT